MWRRTSKANQSRTKGPADPTSHGIAAIVNNLFQFRTSKIRIEDLSPNDVVVAVMGPTGSGKSSFIEMATGVTGLVGHTLASFTTEISVIRLSFPGLNLCFVDTPGFDGTNKSDVDVFKMISDWLNSTYKREILLTGLLYFHRISDNRMEGTQLKNLRMFENLCGKEFNGIVLTTTMWDEVSEELGAERESALKDEYWKSLIERGSSVKRFLSTQQSAFEILMPILEEVDRRSVLLLQNEMNDLQLQLKDTSAGKTLHIELGELVARHQDVLRRMRDPIDDADQFQLLMEEHQRVSVQLQRASEDMRRMKIPRRRRIKGFDWRSIFSLFKVKKKTDERDRQGQDQERGVDARGNCV